jgi:hypothetical protein
MYLQGVADTVDSNGNVTNSYAGHVVKLETSLSNNPEKFSKDFTLLKVDIEVDDSDPETFKVDSIQADSQLLHFVTAARQGDVVLKADLPDSIKDKVTWETTVAGITLTPSPADKRIVSVSTEAENTKNGIQIPFKLKIDGTVVKEGNIWIVWTSLLQAPQFSAGKLSSELGAGSSGLRLDLIDSRFSVQPVAIRDLTQDIPDLRGESISSPPSGEANSDTFPHYLADETRRWDMSRQIRLRVLPNDDAVEDITITENEVPLKSYLSFPIDVVGNDDPSNTDETTFDLLGGGVFVAPYNSNVLIMHDSPSFTLFNSRGTLGDVVELRDHFRDFVRLNLGDDSSNAKWFRISNYVEWRVHFKLKKIADSWVDDGSDAALDNAGF